MLVIYLSDWFCVQLLAVRDFGEMERYVPSWNTDQGVQRTCKCNRVNPGVRSESIIMIPALAELISVNLVVGGNGHRARLCCEWEHARWDPKDGELYLGWSKPEETLVEDLAFVLTCKSLIRTGYRGERLIEPSSSWFPPKFPSG